MAINFDADKVIKNFKAPNYFRWAILPFIIILLVGYIAGIAPVIKDYKAGGYTTHTPESTCKAKIQDVCMTATNPDDCYKMKIGSCPTIEGKTSKYVPIAVYVVIPIIIALTITSIIYYIKLAIMNPKLAAGVIVTKMLFK